MKILPQVPISSGDLLLVETKEGNHSLLKALPKFLNRIMSARTSLSFKRLSQISKKGVLTQEDAEWAIKTVRIFQLAFHEASHFVVSHSLFTSNEYIAGKIILSGNSELIIDTNAAATFRKYIGAIVEGLQHLENILAMYISPDYLEPPFEFVYRNKSVKTGGVMSVHDRQMADDFKKDCESEIDVEEAEREAVKIIKSNLYKLNKVTGIIAVEIVQALLEEKRFIEPNDLEEILVQNNFERGCLAYKIPLLT